MNKKSILTGVLASFLLIGCGSGPQRIEPVERDVITVKSFEQQKKDFDAIESSIKSKLKSLGMKGVVKRQDEHNLLVSFDQKGNFEVQDAKVKKSLRKTLRKIANTLSDYENVKVYVDGHTDDSGDESINYDLSRDRAENAANILTDNGMKSYQVIYEGWGSKINIDKNYYKSQKKNNRRIELIIKTVYLNIPESLKGTPH